MRVLELTMQAGTCITGYQGAQLGAAQSFWSLSRAFPAIRQPSSGLTTPQCRATTHRDPGIAVTLLRIRRKSSYFCSKGAPIPSDTIEIVSPADRPFPLCVCRQGSDYARPRHSSELKGSGLAHEAFAFSYDFVALAPANGKGKGVQLPSSMEIPAPRCSY